MKNKPIMAVHACWDITEPDTRKRELKGLVDACKNLNLAKADGNCF